jgi:hypothetical protein
MSSSGGKVRSSVGRVSSRGVGSDSDRRYPREN